MSIPDLSGKCTILKSCKWPYWFNKCTLIHVCYIVVTSFNELAVLFRNGNETIAQCEYKRRREKSCTMQTQSIIKLPDTVHFRHYFPYSSSHSVLKKKENRIVVNLVHSIPFRQTYTYSSQSTFCSHISTFSSSTKNDKEWERVEKSLSVTEFQSFPWVSVKIKWKTSLPMNTLKFGQMYIQWLWLCCLYLLRSKKENAIEWI